MIWAKEETLPREEIERIPVSYTHLDVYKRQTICDRRTEQFPICQS